jgi:hypothetical protein
MRRVQFRSASSLIVALTFAVATSDAGADPRGLGAPVRPSPHAGAHVLRAAEEFADGGGYNRDWSGSGCPAEVRFGGQKVLGKAAGGTYCSGFTFAVAMTVAERRGLLAGKDLTAVRAFQKEWYGATPAARETQCALAMERLGIGRAVPLDDALPGDFVQLWRVKDAAGKVSGHSVVLVSWVIEDGRRVGLTYRSSQASTDGIGTATERFADAAAKPGRVDRARTYAGRLAAAPDPPPQQRP